MSASSNVSGLASEAQRRRAYGSGFSTLSRAGQSPVWTAANSGTAGTAHSESYAGSAARRGNSIIGGGGIDVNLFNQTVQKLSEAVSHMPTVAVVRF